MGFSRLFHTKTPKVHRIVSLLFGVMFSSYRLSFTTSSIFSQYSVFSAFPLGFSRWFSISMGFLSGFFQAFPIRRLQRCKGSFTFSVFSMVSTGWFFQGFFHFDSKGAKDCKSCRSRKMLQNEPTLAIVAVHTEENGPNSAEVKIQNIKIFILLIWHPD